jgi:hypothetical protein
LRTREFFRALTRETLDLPAACGITPARPRHDQKNYFFFFLAAFFLAVFFAAFFLAAMSSLLCSHYSPLKPGEHRDGDWPCARTRCAGAVLICRVY